MRKELKVALEAVKKAGKLQLQMQSSLGSRIDKGGLDFATKADVDSQTLIVEALKEDFPNIPIIAEEDDPQITKGKKFWLVDPIDGTGDFAEGGESWGVFVALIENGRPSVGVAYQPARNMMLSVEKGSCLLNGAPVDLRYKKPLKHSVIGTEIGWWCNKSYYKDFLGPLSQQCQGVVSTLSACGSTMRLIEGKMGAYVNLGVPGQGAKLWDFAVGALAMEVLGGYATDPYGNELTWDKIPMQAVLTPSKEIWERIIALSSQWKY